MLYFFNKTQLSKGNFLEGALGDQRKAYDRVDQEILAS